MGEVLEAVRTGPGGFRMPVALKRLVAEDAIRGDVVQRFFAEARILARLDHPNIVRVHELLAIDAGYFIVMELLRGVTLADLASRAHEEGGAPPWPEVLAVADQALAGLAYAHAATGDDGMPLGLVHRDVTPRNLFVTDAGAVKLLDFGIAKLHERLEAPITREGTVHGTLELLSPEQAAGENADASTDLYQLGTAMYWSLSGRYPHGSGSAPELLARIISSAPRSLAELRPDLPAAVVGVIERAMTRERGGRFVSADAMREAVREVLAGSGAGGDHAADLRAAVAALRADRAESDEPRTETDTESPETGPTVTAETAALAPTVPAPPPRRERRWPIAGAALGAAAIGATGLWLARDRAEERAPTEAREVMLTLAAGDQQPMGGGLSRDAARVVYATGSEVVVKPVAGGRAERLALPPGFRPIDAEFVSDGRVMAYGQNQSGEWQVWRLGYGAPALIHSSPTRFLARVSPDGGAVACAHDERSIDLVVPNAPVRVLVGLDAGEMVSGMAWSPDGRRLVFVRTAADGGDDPIQTVDVGPAASQPRTVHRRPFAAYTAVMITWPHPARLLYAINDRHGATLYSLDLDGAVERPVHRWVGLTVTGGRWAGGRLIYNRGTQRYGIFVGDRGGRLTRMSTGDGQARRLAGWTDQGWLFYANDAAGNLDIVAHPPGDLPALWMSGEVDEMPDTLIGGDVIFQRAEQRDGGGQAIGLWRSSAPGDARRLTSLVPSGVVINAVRCAGDRRPPCVIEEVERGRAHYRLFDPDSGARGREIAVLPARGSYLRNMAVSPDGSTLAVVRGGNRVALFDVESGAPGELAVSGISDLQSISWSADGDALLVTGFGWRGWLFAALRVQRDGAVEPIETSHQRWYWRVQESPDGKRLAVVEVEFAIDLATLEGI